MASVDYVLCLPFDIWLTLVLTGWAVSVAASLHSGRYTFVSQVRAGHLRGRQGSVWGSRHTYLPWVQVDVLTRRVMELWQGRTDPMSAWLCEVPAGVGTGAGVSTVSRVRIVLLRDRQGCGRGAGVPICHYLSHLCNHSPHLREGFIFGL